MFCNIFWWIGAVQNTAANVHIYLNGSEVTYQTTTNGATLDTDANDPFMIGAQGAGLRDWNGGIDEARVSNIIRSADWITTEYNNQSSPSTFYAVGAETEATNPTVSTLSPADNATGVSPTANLVITFDEAVNQETGNILIKQTSDDSTVETIDVAGALVTGDGTATITVNPSVTLTDSTEYYVQIATTAFDDTSGNSYAGITDTTSWSFTTGDTTNPTVSTLSPADNATGVSPTANLVITFDEAVNQETGNILIKQTSDDSTVETIDVAGALVTGDGTATITVNPSVTLTDSTEYYVQIATTAFDDTSGNSYAGITDTTSWSFTIMAPPTLTTSATSSVTTTTATLNGNITVTGGENSTARGFNYGLTTSYGTTTTTAGSFGVSAFTDDIASLTCNTLYHFRSYATNSAGTGLSTDTTFTTASCASHSSGSWSRAVTPPTVPSVQNPIFNFFENIIPSFLKPKPEIKPTETSVIVPQKTPLVFQTKWRLLPNNAEFVLAPLPKAITNLAQKFPTLKKTFKEVGISKITDVTKLSAVNLTLPGLTERVGLPIAQIDSGRFALPKGVPIAKLSSQTKQKLPTEIVFAKTGAELIDFNFALSVSKKGEPQQRISTIVGKPLQLVIKPDKPVTSVKGYVVFKSKISTSNFLEIPSDSLLAYAIFASPVFAQTQEKPVRVEEKLVLLEFEYTDPDGDGIYTAEIDVPLVEGEYEIITVMDFKDAELGNKEIRLITVVDPEGYVYEKYGDKEIRVPGAVVSIFRLNLETKQYELWSAKEYQQENPQTTDIRGTYSFLVPEGYYYLGVEAPGYLAYDGKSFQVKEGSGIHINIELKTKYWWLKIVDWKTILLITVIILLLYNFYRDKIREKMKIKSI